MAEPYVSIYAYRHIEKSASLGISSSSTALASSFGGTTHRALPSGRVVGVTRNSSVLPSCS